LLAETEAAGAKNEAEQKLEETKLPSSQLEEPQLAEGLDFPLLSPSHHEKKNAKKDKKATGKRLKMERKAEKEDAKQDRKKEAKEEKFIHKDESKEHKEDKKHTSKAQKEVEKLEHTVEKAKEKRDKAEDKANDVAAVSNKVGSKVKLVDQDKEQLKAAIKSLREIRASLDELEHDPQNILKLAEKCQASAAASARTAKEQATKDFQTAMGALQSATAMGDLEKAQKIADESQERLEMIGDEEDADARQKLSAEHRLRSETVKHAASLAEKAAKNMLADREYAEDAQAQAGEKEQKIREEGDQVEFVAEHLRDEAQRQQDHANDAIERIFFKADSFLLEIQREATTGKKVKSKLAKKKVSGAKKLNSIKERLAKLDSHTPSPTVALTEPETLVALRPAMKPGYSLCLFAAASLGLVLFVVARGQVSLFSRRAPVSPPLLG